MIKFPMLVTSLLKDEVEMFDEFYKQSFRDIERNKLEGMWFRTQTEANKTNSGWKGQADRRRRVLHFLDTYGVIENENEKCLQLESTYLYLSTSLPENELEEYYQCIKGKLKGLINESNNNSIEIYNFGDLSIEIEKHIEHPMDIEAGRLLPKNYQTLDIIVHNKKFVITEELSVKPWVLFKKGIRSPGIKGTPLYIETASDLLKYLPAQIELGCGPSIESNVPPLHQMHETYKVQNHEGNFYIGPGSDDLIVKLLEDPYKTYEEFTNMFKSCVLSKPSNSHFYIKELFNSGHFVGEILSNNFDMLCERVGLEEHLLRTYEPEKFFPTIDFHPNAKSLICIGTHADRKLIQLQARLKGLKVIYIDPEGYHLKDGSFRPYLLESPKDEDIVFRTTAKEGLEELVKQLNVSRLEVRV
ncbi:hypothetical protein [Brevibacillus reuszeri]|uniref:hypothetical protein n=1 Tax=Brevibacillus reuszeri TaxID=54915 RepID=UPI003D234BD1